MGLSLDQAVGGQEDLEDQGGREEGEEDPVCHLQNTKVCDVQYISITTLICREPANQFYRHYGKVSYLVGVEGALQVQWDQGSDLLLALQDPGSVLDPYLGETRHGDPHLEDQPSLPLTSALTDCLKKPNVTLTLYHEKKHYCAL